MSIFHVKFSYHHHHHHKEHFKLIQKPAKTLKQTYVPEERDLCPKVVEHSRELPIIVLLIQEAVDL